MVHALMLNIPVSYGNVDKLMRPSLRNQILKLDSGYQSKRR